MTESEIVSCERVFKSGLWTVVLYSDVVLVVSPIFQIELHKINI